MTTAPASPAPTLADQLAYLRQRIEKAECGPVTLCRRDLDAVKALLAEVERREGQALDEARAICEFVQRVDARAEADILRGNPITGAHHRAIRAEAELLRPRAPVVAEVERRREGEAGG